MSRSLLCVAFGLVGLHAGAASPVLVSPADLALTQYFRAHTEQIAARSFTGADSLAAWEARRSELRRQLLEMLGLWPLPERTDLQATVTGRIEHEDVVVENLHFQSLPGLYVTANLYRPVKASGPLPAILYACGHAVVKTNGISCGNKTGYQHHGLWFARHGYVCLLIDTLQLGEIEGDHHGTHRLGQWWWNARGYTPAGVEAWNCVRALDYLVSRPEVDASRLGMTGRSGGGSYTWTTAAIDDRIRVAAPVAGITDLRNHIVDGVVEGHCDCMYFLNTHRWDFDLQAALLAPRPLLIVNTDADPIFPLEGVLRLHARVKEVYGWYQAHTNLGLVIAPGPHRDTQDLQVPVFRWFNQHLQGGDPPIAEAAVKRFAPLALRAFDTLPADERNTRAQDWFGPATADPIPPHTTRDRVLELLREEAFSGWPEAPSPLEPRLTADRREDGLRWRTWEFESEPHVPLQLHAVHADAGERQTVLVRILDAAAWDGWSDQSIGERWRETQSRVPEASAVAFFAPRGIGPSAWSGDARKQVHIRRRFMLLGQTLDGMRVWDIRRALEAVRAVLPGVRRLDVQAEGGMAVNGLYAALYESGIHTLHLSSLPASHREGPDYFRVLRVLDIPQATALARASGMRVVGGQAGAEARE